MKMPPLQAKRLAAAVLLIAVAAAAGEADKPIKVGDILPDFTLEQLVGEKIKLSALLAKEGKKRPVMLVFWCTTCHSCRDIDKQLVKLAADFKETAAIYAVAINAGESKEVVNRFLKSQQLDLPVLLDERQASADLFKVKVTTTTLVIDGEQRLRYRGRFTGKESFAANALKAVLDAKEVKTPTTADFG